MKVENVIKTRIATFGEINDKLVSLISLINRFDQLVYIS